MSRVVSASVSAIALGLMGLSLSAAAEPPHCPPGHAKKGWCDHDRDRAARSEQRAYEEGYHDGQRDAIRYGDRSYNEYQVIRDYDRYGLRAPRDGYYYAELDSGEIVMVAIASQLIE